MNTTAKPLLIDIGCGKNKRGPEWVGVDILEFDGVDFVFDAGKDKWPWKDGEVDQVHASHFVEHLTPAGRIHFVNEMDRVLKKPEYVNGQLITGFATVIVPHWASQRAYGDLTHQWPPVSEFWFYYLDKDWRAVNAPHNLDYTCNLLVNWGYNLHPELQSRNQEYQHNAMKWWKEACSDTVATLMKKPS
jgi:hypothetical protein